MRRKIWRLVMVVFYAAVLLLVVVHQDMLAMYGMAVGMLVEAVMGLVKA